MRRLLREDVPSSAALLRLARELERLGETRSGERNATAAGAPTLAQIARNLREAASDDAIEAAARILAANVAGCGCSGDEPPEPTQAQREEVAQRLAREALGPLAADPSLLSGLGGR